MKKIRITPIILAAGLILATAARVFAVSRTDMNTGLLYHDSSLLCNILYYGIIVLTAAGAAVTSYFDEKRGFGGTNIKASSKAVIVIGFALLLTALCAGYDGMFEAKALTPTSFLIFTDFISAGALCVIALVTLYMKEFKPGLGFAYIFGGIYYVCRGIYCFMSRMAIATIPEYLVDCLTVICGGVFFVMFARVFSGNSAKLTMRAFYAWGSAACVLSLSSFFGAGVSKLVLSSGISERIVFLANDAERYFQALRGIDAYQMAFSPLPNAALGVFAAAAMIVVGFSERAEEK